jgi:site-specific DNA-methyltransferase (adenine-specific)/modification methylase
MSPGEAYDKGVRKDQLTGSYGDFRPVEVRSEGGRWPTDVVYFKTAESEGPVWHPTQKPVALGRYLVRTYTRPGDVVLDSASGSGSFLVAALAEGRNFIGIERNEEVHFFKKERIDSIAVTTERLRAAWARLDPEVDVSNVVESPLLASFGPARKDAPSPRRKRASPARVQGDLFERLRE